MPQKTLPSGVRFILGAESGTPLESVHDLRLNGLYLCSSTPHYVRLNYGQLRMQSSSGGTAADQVDNSSTGHRNHHLNRATATSRLFGMLSTSVQVPSRHHSKHPSSNGSSLTLSTNGPLSSLSHSLTSNPSAVRPKIVALLQGSCRAAPTLRPSRRAFRFLLNHRIAQDYEQLLNEISTCVQLNVGAVHQIYGLSTAKKVSWHTNYDGRSVLTTSFHHHRSPVLMISSTTSTCTLCMAVQRSAL